MPDPTVAALMAALDVQDCTDDDHLLCEKCAGRVLAALADAGFARMPPEDLADVHRPTDAPSAVEGWPACRCGKPWLPTGDRCTTGARRDDRVATSEEQQLRNRLVALGARLLRLRSFDDDPADEELRLVAVALRDEADRLTRPRTTT
jgi:hypothetical protein